MTLDTTQILIIVLVGVLIMDAIKEMIRDAHVWALINTLAGGNRAPTFPPAPPVVVPPVVPPAGPPVVVPPVVEPPVVVPPVAPPVVVPPVVVQPVGHSKVVRGPCSFFGGPHDTGVKSDEGLAIVERSDFGHGNWGGIFLPTQPAGTTGLARALNPDAHYIACRWDYAETSKKYLQGINVTVKANGKVATDVRPVDWGPNAKTGRVADLSPGLMAFLGLNTDDAVEVDIPLPSLGPAQPTLPPAANIPAPVTHWPHDDNAAMIAFYGAPGSVTLSRFVPPFKIVDADSKSAIAGFFVHPKCLPAFTAAFSEIWDHCNHDQAMIEKFNLHKFGGCYNKRLVRGSADKWSVHAFAAAIDINPDGAPMGVDQRPTQENLPDFAVAAFKRQGATWGGDFRSRKDWMHFQFVTEN